MLVYPQILFIYFWHCQFLSVLHHCLDVKVSSYIGDGDDDGECDGSNGDVKVMMVMMLVIVLMVMSDKDNSGVVIMIMIILGDLLLEPLLCGYSLH